MTLCAIGYAYKWNAANPDSALVGATAIFGGGIAHMIDDIIPGSYTDLELSYWYLTYSAFCLTSLDTATRLARFMFQEFWLEPGQTPKDIKEWLEEGYGKSVLCNHPYSCSWYLAWYDRICKDLGSVWCSQPASCRYRSS